MSIKGAPPQRTAWQSGVVLGNGIQDGKKEEMKETVEETWARNYSVNGDIISANTAIRVLDVSPLRKGRVDREDSGTEQVVENGECQSDNLKLYCTGRETEEKGMTHKSQNGSGKSLSEYGYQESYSTK